MPLIWCHRVCDERHHLARESHRTWWIHERKGDRLSSVSYNSPVTVVPAMRAAMKSVAVVLIEVSMVCVAIDGKGTILDPVRIAAWDTVKVRMQGALRVVGSVVESKDNITLYTMGISDEEIGKARSIRDEVCANAFGTNFVFAVSSDSSAIARNRWLLESTEDESR